MSFKTNNNCEKEIEKVIERMIYDSLADDPESLRCREADGRNLYKFRFHLYKPVFLNVWVTMVKIRKLNKSIELCNNQVI